MTDASRLLAEVASEANLATALLNVVRNKGAPGLDGQTVPQAPVGKTILTIILVALTTPPERPLADTQQPRRLQLPKLGRFITAKNVQELDHPQTLEGFRPAHPTLQTKGPDLPDRSCAT